MRPRTSPNATPPVTYGIQLPGAAQPNRPRTVPSQVFSVLQLKPVPPATTGPLQTTPPTAGSVGRFELVPLMPDQSRSPSMPQTTAPLWTLKPAVPPARPPLTS